MIGHCVRCKHLIGFTKTIVRQRDSCSSWNEVDWAGVELLSPYCSCYRRSTSLWYRWLISSILCGVRCFNSVYAHDHGRVPIATVIRGDSREYCSSCEKKRSLVFNAKMSLGVHRSPRQLSPQRTLIGNYKLGRVDHYRGSKRTTSRDRW